MDCHMIQFPDHGTADCRLLVAQQGQTLPFGVQRAYWFSNAAPGTHRGRHAHRTLREVLIALHGACTVRVDDGGARREYRLERPDQGLYLGPGLWRELYDFTPDTAILALADQVYDEDDYLRSYEDFLKWVKV